MGALPELPVVLLTQRHLVGLLEIDHPLGKDSRRTVLAPTYNHFRARTAVHALTIPPNYLGFGTAISTPNHCFLLGEKRGAAKGSAPTTELLFGIIVMPRKQIVLEVPWIHSEKAVKAKT